MTTNLNAIAGPSRLSPPPRIGISPDSPSSSVGSELREYTASEPPHQNTSGNANGSGGGNGGGPSGSGGGSGVSVNRTGLSVDDNGEVVRVPAFLQKLYSMVSDEGTDALIYWSDSGDSFFVPNHERFGKEILPRFFKHSNFSSFVRQLNMYGFHKVPQPQSGVLRADNPNDSELWEFINPFFKRGKPEFLSKVMRKNKRPTNPPPSATSTSSGTRSSARQQASHQFSTGNNNAGVSSQYLITDGTTEGEANQLIGTNGQQMIDLSAITNGIAAIRQTQASIGADLKALQASNEHLWREALEARDRHEKHQETIDLIVSFLERLFGTEGEGLKGLKEAWRRGGIGRPREDNLGEEGGTVGKKRKRFGLDRMISDGREETFNPGEQIIELQDEPQIDPFNLTLPARPTRTKSAPSNVSTPPWSSTSQRFQNIPSEDDSPRNSAKSTSALASRIPTPANPFAGFNTTTNPNGVDPTALVPYFNNINQGQNMSYNSNANSNTNVNANGGGGGAAPPLSPNSSAAAASAFNLDPNLLQTTIGSLLQSPAAAQMFLNSLNNSSQGQALQTPSKSMSSGQASYPFNQDLMGGLNFGASVNQPTSGVPTQNVQNPQADNSNNNSNSIDPTLALFSPLPNYNALMQNNDALLKSYQDAAGIGTDVDKLQESIDSLVRSMGLDLNNGNIQEDVKPDIGSLDASAFPGQGYGQSIPAGQGQGGQGLTQSATSGGQQVGAPGQALGPGQMTMPMMHDSGGGHGDLGLDADFDVNQFLDNLGRDGDDQL